MQDVGTMFLYRFAFGSDRWHDIIVIVVCFWQWPWYLSSSIVGIWDGANDSTNDGYVDKYVVGLIEGYCVMFDGDLTVYEMATLFMVMMTIILLMRYVVGMDLPSAVGSVDVDAEI